MSAPLTFDRPLDVARMRRDRHARLVQGMVDQGVDALVLLGQANVSYATGVRVPAADQARAIHRRPIAIVTADGEPPHVWTWFADGAPDDLPADHVHQGLSLEWDEGARQLLDVLPGGQVAIDEFTMPLHGALDGRQLADATVTLSTAKALKTADEVECIRRAQELNEAAIAAVAPTVTPGTRGTEVTGRFLRHLFELGAMGNSVDPIWQVMPSSIAEGPYTITGDVVFPTVTKDSPFAEGDLVWVDNGISYEGYQSDYGHTWVIGRDPDERQRSQCRRWRELISHVLEVTKPGATARDLTRAAEELSGGRRPWLPHFYLAHGIGTDSAEMPFLGTDLGDEFDETVVLAPGMLMVLEPVIWEDGHGGFRAEEIVVVTDAGYDILSTLTWDGWE
ncbi:MAG: M24 family metallopeptidase [Acidimicrobiia bacterium]